MCYGVRMMVDNGITSVSGIRVGHFTDRRAATGCTVVLCESGAVGGVGVGAVGESPLRQLRVSRISRLMKRRGVQRGDAPLPVLLNQEG